jgi:hypothetical protein
MAAAAHGARGAWLPGIDGVLLEIHSFLWRDCRPTHTIVEAGGLPVDASGRALLQLDQGHPNDDPSFVAAGLHAALHCQL